MRYARFKVDPRMISSAKVARRLGVTPAVFAEKRAELEAAGLPKPDSILGTYLLEAVDQWIDQRSSSSSGVGTPITERLREVSWGKKAAKQSEVRPPVQIPIEAVIEEGTKRRRRWEKQVRGAPLVKRELRLKELLAASDGESVTVQFGQGVGPQTIDRFETRGFIVIDESTADHVVVRLTEAGRQAIADACKPTCHGNLPTITSGS